jgi:hypothetical protein
MAVCKESRSDGGLQGSGCGRTGIRRRACRAAAAEMAGCKESKIRRQVARLRWRAARDAVIRTSTPCRTALRLVRQGSDAAALAKIVS